MVVTVMNKIESDDVVHRVWLQLFGVQGVRNGQKLMTPPQHANPRPGAPLNVPHPMQILKPKEGAAHTAVERLLQLAAQVIPSRQAQAYGEIIKQDCVKQKNVCPLRVYVNCGNILGAISTAELVPDTGADTGLWHEIKTVFALDQCLVPMVPAVTLITQTTVQLLGQDVAHVKETEVRAEAHLYLVRVQLQRGNTAAALLSASAMEGGSPAEEQAAWVVWVQQTFQNE